jgi:hypothetical protein
MADNFNILDVGSADLTTAQTFTGAKTFAADVSIADAKNVVLASTTGTKIGTATSQKLGFLGAAPVVRQAAIATPASDIVGTKAAIDAIRAALTAFGFTA